MVESLKQDLEERLQQGITALHPVSGGSINRAGRVETTGGSRYFLKWNSSADPDMFEKEVRGLNLLRSSQTALRIPAPVYHGATKGGTGFLLMEFIPEGRTGKQSATEFGRELAALHKVHNEQYGLDHDNYIGKLPQSNDLHTDWVDFFIGERLQPQLRMALDAGRFDSATRQKFENLYMQLSDLLPEEPPSLLHGDLWSGNYFYDEEGRAAIFDPAVYYGHRETELAFTHLFGGFSNDFYAAYQESYPLEPGFNTRTDLYNLYPLLVHTNLFDGGYARQVEEIVKRFE